jgi:hypothetical protein
VVVGNETDFGFLDGHLISFHNNYNNCIVLSYIYPLVSTKHIILVTNWLPLRESYQLVVLFLRNQAFLSDFPQEVDNFAVISGCGGEHVDLILLFDDDFEGSDELEGLSVDLEGNDLVGSLGLQPDALSLGHLEGYLHAYLYLPHMEDVGQSDYLHYSITERFIIKALLIIGLP